METLFVVPRDPLEDRSLDLGRVRPGALHLDQLGLESAVMALSYESATELTDAEAPMSASRSIDILGEFNRSLQHRVVVVSVAVLEDLGRGLPAEDLAGSVFDSQGDGFEVLGGPPGQVGALRVPLYL